MRPILLSLLLVLVSGVTWRGSAGLTAGHLVPCDPTGTPLQHAPVSLTHLMVNLQTAYARSDWSAVRGVTSDSVVANELVKQMQAWKVDHVGHLTVSLVFTESLTQGRYVGTVRFQADPRAPPVIALYLFGGTQGKPEITGRVLGVCGPSYAHADWTVTRTRHFIVYHSPLQLRGADHIYLGYLEHQRALFAARFRVKLPSVTAFYLYPDPSLMRKLTNGRCGGGGEVGCTAPFTSPPTIHAVIQAVYHEPIHVYQRSLEPPPTRNLIYVDPLFISEGMAVALEDRQLDPGLSDYCSDLDYSPLDECARSAASDVNPMSLLPDSGFDHANPGDAYALGGSFVRYLILRYGYYKFGRFYYVLAAQPKDRVVDYDVAARRVFKQGIRPLMSSWHAQLCAHGC